jgi:1,2-diacylglycerol 3-alpha-glucosyltransferase
MSGMSGQERPARVLLACSGLEHTNRGFESFARECFDVLRDDLRLELELVKATGPERDGERTVRAIKRDDRIAAWLGRGWKGPLQVEQLLFALSLQPEILRRRPDVIYLSEWYTGVGLARLRALNRQQYAIVLSNGSMAADGFEPFDRVHQHTAPAFEYVMARGADPARHVLLPVAFKFDPVLETISADDREAIRHRVQLPTDRPVVISVAALNSWHKRLDYLIAEVAKLPEPRPFLLLVGQPEAETARLRKMAHELLGDEGHSIRTVPGDQVSDLLRASDLFVLASFAEGLPRALVEAVAHGLPCLAHDYPITRYATGDLGLFADFQREGALADLIARSIAAGDDSAGAHARHKYVYDSFSWDSLAPQYVELLHGAVGRADFAERPLTVKPSA